MKTKVEWFGKEVSKATRRVVSKKIRQATFLIQGDIIENAPVVTGRFKGSIDTEISKFLGIIYSNLDYSIWIELGTEPHWIGSNVKIGNSWVYIGMHPGTEAQPVFRMGLFNNENNIKRIFNDNKL